MGFRGKGFSKLFLLEEVKRLLLSKVSPLPVERVQLINCLGRVLGEDFKAPIDLPSFDRSAVDGYAVKAEDTFTSSPFNPRRLHVIGRSVIGEPCTLMISSGEAVKINTGAPLPKGANAVIMLEYAKEVNGYVEVYGPVTPGKNVSRRGEDVKMGDVILKRGRRLRPQDIAIAAACGVIELPVVRKPKVLIVPTGRELKRPGTFLREGEVYESNSYALYAFTLIHGGEPYIHEAVEGTAQDVRNVLKQVDGYDLLVFTGGASVGEEDVIPETLSEEGTLLAHGLAIKPGMPTAVAIVKGKPVFSLPGFPVACMIAFEELVAPTIRKMLGVEEEAVKVKAVASRYIPGEVGRRVYVRVKLEERNGRFYAHPVRTSGSGIISSMVKADGYIVIPENVEGVGEGEEVDVYLYA
ncbi:MAG: molybdopterin molybdotransferase MoeA [Candidatus Nezhaarchaeales archaeon]